MSRTLPESRQEDFGRLVQNGIDFLEKAITQLETEPKYSIINFYTAVELLLKAPLVLNHWSLIIADREPSIQKYRNGDFRSIGFEDTCSRLESVLEKPLTPVARLAFDGVRKHRNKMVHFFHGGLTIAEIEDIRSEQAKAWFELNYFLTENHKEVFASYLRDFSWMERMLRTKNSYAKIKFQKLEPEINLGKKNGKVFSLCPICKMDAYESVRPTPHISDLSIHTCWVCLHQETKLRVDCPGCGDATQYITPASQFDCSICHHEISEGGIYDFLDNSQYGPDNYFEEITPANCDECQSYQSVCEFHGGYLCSSCLTYFDALYSCGYCGEYGTELMEDSFWGGCEHCEGNAGRHAED